MDIKSSVFLINNPENSLKARADVTLNDEFVVKGITVVEGKNGIFVSMPQRKANDSYYQTFFPITNEAREQLNKSVLDAYNQMLEQKEEVKEEQKNENKGSKSNKKVQLNEKKGAEKSHKADDAPSESNEDISQDTQEETEAPVMSM